MQQYRNRLFLAVIFFWFAQYVYIPFQTPYLSSLGVPADFIGVIIGVYGVSQMLLRIPVGVSADSGNRHKHFILCGGLAAGAGCFCRVIFKGGAGFLVANLCSGLASAMWISFMVLYMSFYKKGEQQKATSQMILANNMGIFLGFAISTLLYDLVGMQILCLFGVVSAGLSVLLVCTLLDEKKLEEKDSIPLTQLLKVCRDKRLVIFAIFTLVQQGIQMATVMSFTSRIIQELGGNSFIVGISSVIYMLSSICWAKLASWDICSSVPMKVWITLGFVITGCYCIFVPNMNSVTGIFVLQILPGMSTGIQLSYLTSEAMKNIPEKKKSTAMGFFQAVYAFGMTAFPMISGKIVDYFSIKTAYYVLGIVSILAALGAWGYYASITPVD